MKKRLFQEACGAAHSAGENIQSLQTDNYYSNEKGVELEEGDNSVLVKQCGCI